MSDRLFAVRFTSTVEVTYTVSAASEDAAMEFTPSEWPDPGADARWTLSYGEFQPLEGEFSVEDVTGREPTTVVWSA